MEKRKKADLKGKNISKMFVVSCCNWLIDWIHKKYHQRMVQKIKINKNTQYLPSKHTHPFVLKIGVNQTNNGTNQILAPINKYKLFIWTKNSFSFYFKFNALSDNQIGHPNLSWREGGREREKKKAWPIF